jgi:muramoyltetrapeptide carboxypeptidase
MAGGIKGAALQAGNKIGVVAPGSPVGSGEVLAGIGTALTDRGYGVVWGETARETEGYLAGSDLERRADLERMWLDESIAAIWCLRGGYGSIRLLRRLYFRLFVARPKILIGFSDITALELGLWSQIRLVTFHGPVLTTLNESEFSKNQAFRMLSGKLTGDLDWPETEEPRCLSIRPGKARGRILGGNLATVCSLIGTCFFPDLDGAIFFLEETGEAAYRIDRMLTQLILTGVLDSVAAVMVGRCIPVAGENEADLIKVFQERLGQLNCPSGYGFPIGHKKEQWTLPQGVMAEVDMEAGEFELMEEGVLP